MELKRAVERCEDFWMDLAEDMTPAAFLPYKERSELSAAYSLFYGNQRAFTPLWMYGGMPLYYFFNSPYLYDINQLKRTVFKHVDFTKLSSRQKEEEEEEIQSKNKDGKSNSHEGSRNNKDNITNAIPRLILTATNVQTGEPVVFDSNEIDITVDHVMASAGYAVYGLPWTKIDDSYF